MPRALDPDLLAAMNSGKFVPYFNVQLMDVDRTSVQFQTTEVVGFDLNGLTAKIVFHDPEYFDDYYMFRIQRGILVDGVPNFVTSSCYWPSYDRHENFIRTIEGHVFPNQFYTTPGDVTYSSIIATVCTHFGFDVVHEDPAADWLSYQFLPNTRDLVLNNAKWFFTLLRQKYLVFATDYDDDILYFFQAKSTGPTFPDDYTLLQANHKSITGHGAFKEKTLFSRDENNDYHYSGGDDKPIHNLGFLSSTAAHPDNYSFIDTQNWIIQNIPPNLKYLDFDPIYVNLDFGDFSIWPTKFVEFYNSNLSPSWQWQARFLDVFGDTEGGAMPNTIQPSAPFTPLSTLNFDHNLDQTVTNLQALAEAVDELDFPPSAEGVTGGDSHDHFGGDGAQIDHGSQGGLIDDDHTQYIKHSLATAVSDFLVASGAGAFVNKTLAEVKSTLGLGSAAYTSSGDYAVAAKGVTGGDAHDHVGGDGAQIDHGGLGGLADDDHTQYIKHSLATAVSDFLVASGAGAFVKKTLAEVKTILGLGSAAYTPSTDYVKHSLATAANDFLVASGAGAFVKKTLSETITTLAHESQHEFLGPDVLNLKNLLMFQPVTFIAGFGEKDGYTTTLTGGRGSATHGLITSSLQSGNLASDLVGYNINSSFTVAPQVLYRIKFSCKIMPQTNTKKTEFWVGLFNPAASFPTTICYHIGFRVLETAGVSDGAHVFASNGNNVNGVQTDVWVAAQYAGISFGFELTTTNIKYYINGSLAATHTLYLPSFWGLYFGIWLKTTEAVVKSVDTYSPMFLVD
jgi:hypothetical protein